MKKKSKDQTQCEGKTAKMKRSPQNHLPARVIPTPAQAKTQLRSRQQRSLCLVGPRVRPRLSKLNPWIWSQTKVLQGLSLPHLPERPPATNQAGAASLRTGAAVAIPLPARRPMPDLLQDLQDMLQLPALQHPALQKRRLRQDLQQMLQLPALLRPALQKRRFRPPPRHQQVQSQRPQQSRQNGSAWPTSALRKRESTPRKHEKSRRPPKRLPKRLPKRRHKSPPAGPSERAVQATTLQNSRAFAWP
mmetsp:Transcript_153173/g.285428  ORF Transcript_153173/g.285428 Transcript_153173/m.285428 type:complete len:247 (+) Transcript_153173:76-816(+)